MLNILGDLWWPGALAAGAKGPLDKSAHPPTEPAHEPDWAAVLALPGLHAGTIKTYADDAGSSAFGDGAARSVAELRLRLGTWLDAQAPAPRDRWHDPRPRTQDPSRLKPISALPPPASK